MKSLKFNQSSFLNIWDAKLARLQISTDQSNLGRPILEETNEWFQAVFFYVLKGRVARRFSDGPDWDRSGDARFPAPGQRRSYMEDLSSSSF